jgi:hypothetical protein
MPRTPEGWDLGPEGTRVKAARNVRVEILVTRLELAEMKAAAIQAGFFREVEGELQGNVGAYVRWLHHTHQRDHRGKRRGR